MCHKPNQMPMSPTNSICSQIQRLPAMSVLHSIRLYEGLLPTSPSILYKVAVCIMALSHHLISQHSHYIRLLLYSITGINTGWVEALSQYNQWLPGPPLCWAFQQLLFLSKSCHVSLPWQPMWCSGMQVSLLKYKCNCFCWKKKSFFFFERGLSMRVGYICRLMNTSVQ